MTAVVTPEAGGVVQAAADRAGWVARINASWRASVEAMLDVAALLLKAKAALPHGEFSKMIADDLPFGDRTAQRLMAIAKDPVLSNPTHASHLPSSWMTLHELTTLPKPVLTQALAAGTITPETTRRDVARLREDTRPKVAARPQATTSEKPTTSKAINTTKTPLLDVLVTEGPEGLAEEIIARVETYFTATDPEAIRLNILVDHLGVANLDPTIRHDLGRALGQLRERLAVYEAALRVECPGDEVAMPRRARAGR